jgi:hypothetical protein
MAAVAADSVIIDIVANTGEAQNNVVQLTNSIERNMARAANGTRNLGRQISDIGVGLASGQSPFLIIAQQAPQVADALADTEGKAASAARFFAGPWGAALLAAASIVGVFVSHLGEAGDALNMAKTGSDGLSDAQGVLGRMFDLTSGKLEHQNDLLRLNARLVASNLRAEAAKQGAASSAVFGETASTPVLSRLAAFFSRTGGNPFTRENQLSQRSGQIRSIVEGVQSGKLTSEAAFQQADKLDFRNLAVTKVQLEQAIIDAASATLKTKVADAIDKSLDNNSLDPTLRNDPTVRRARQARARKAPDETIRPIDVPLTNQVDAFGRQFDREGSAGFADVLKELQQLQKGRLNDAEQLMPDKAPRDQLSGYLDSIHDLNGALRDVAADGLKSLTDGITDAIMHAHSLGDAFKGVAKQIIADLVRIAVERAIVAPLAGALFGGGTGGSAGVLTSLLGRASGGSVTGGQMYRVNEGSGRSEAFVPQGSGKIIPLGQMDAAMGRGSTTVVHQHFNLDARYGITTPELLSYVNDTANKAGAQAGAASFRASQAATPGRMQRAQTLGT